MALQHLRSSTANKRPTPGAMSDGQLALNTNLVSPGLFFKDSNGDLVKIGPVHVGTTAPNVTPGAGGQAGNSKGEQWLDTTGGVYVFKIYDGTAWRSETGTFVDVNGDTMTGALGIIAGSAASPGLFFSGDTNSGLYSPGADQVAVATNGTGRLFVDASGNVGVAAAASTWNLGKTLEVSGTKPVALWNPGDGFNALSNIYYNSGYKFSTTGGYGLYYQQGTASGAHIFATTTATGSANGAATFSETLRITAAGLVGIGTSSPSANLELASGPPSFKLTRNNTASTGNDFARILFENSAGTTLGSIRGYSDNGNTNLGLKLSTGTGDTVALTIDSSQRVGIGTTSPNERLDVRGKLYLNNGSASYFDAASSGGLIITNPTAVRWEVNSSERARIDSSGRLLVGTSSARSNLQLSTGFGSVTPNHQFETSAATYEGLSLINNSTGYPAVFSLGKSRSAGGIGSNGIVANGDIVGMINFYGNDDSKFVRAATITAEVDGTPGANDMPGRLVFSTTADGASSPTERMKIGNSGETAVFGQNTVFNAKSAAAASAGGDRFFQGWYGASSLVAGGTISFVVYTNGNVQNTNNSYGAISDAKLKENIVDANSQWSDLKALQVRNYNLKEGQTHTQIGLVAQEAELVSPGLVSESPDCDAEGNDLGTVTKSVNYSVLYMKAVKALQEAMERIETLEARLTAAGIE